MATVTFHGDSLEVAGTLPKTGTTAPDFTLTSASLGDIKLADFKGQKLLLNIFPSIDTGVCATSVRTFNKRAAELSNTTVLCVSADLPFAAGRFCAAEGIDNVKTASTFRNPEFLKNYGVELVSGPVRGLATRAVVCIDEQGKVTHSELVGEVTNEPNYDAAIKALA